ncbi:peptidoglycan recognition protein family protein [Sulfuriroseicoccus oceanibius]|uniref:N-acetylmuramoyl-L-alanine amidase n=1 Tax=Sulfuriroseicoccus oceanibius TaxID=2707525 RepID=A0A7T7EZY1_9BACT|nr:peptidoglycan recognition family protein [Sulfuriroseicoccus oceanibius]QQL44144.1 N-acetylmuramoyl-L-alanine amidase [Sulfuriroseicoccus oceanibius]
MAKRAASGLRWSVWSGLVLFGVVSCGDAGKKAQGGATVAPVYPEVVKVNGDAGLGGREKNAIQVESTVDMSEPVTGFEMLGAEVRTLIDQGIELNGRPDWRGVVIHSSGEPAGSAAAFRYYHERVLGFDEGMGYHFVIGNGRGAADGSVAVGSRWLEGKEGGAVRESSVPRIDICLVGDFSEDPPTKAQMLALRELLAVLESRLGEFALDQVRGHDHVEYNRRPCPGPHFPIESVRAHRKAVPVR